MLNVEGQGPSLTLRGLLLGGIMLENKKQTKNYQETRRRKSCTAEEHIYLSVHGFSSQPHSGEYGGDGGGSGLGSALGASLWGWAGWWAFRRTGLGTWLRRGGSWAWAWWRAQWGTWGTQGTLWWCWALFPWALFRAPLQQLL